MSWGTDFKADIYLSRQVFSSIGCIEDAIDECDDTITTIGAKFKMFAACTPKDVVVEDGDPVNYLNSELSSLIDEYIEAIEERYKLNLYLEAVKENPELLKQNT